MTNQQPPDDYLPPACTRTQELLFTILDAKAASDEAIQQLLSIEEHLLLSAHLADCGHCQAYKQTMSHLIGSLNNLEEVSLPAGLADRIMAQLPAGSSEQTSRKVITKQKAGWKQAASIAAAILLVALAIPTVMQIFTPTPSNTEFVAQQFEAYPHDNEDLYGQPPETDRQMAMNPRQSMSMEEELFEMNSPPQETPQAGLQTRPIQTVAGQPGNYPQQQDSPASNLGQPPNRPTDGQAQGSPSPNHQVDGTELASAAPQAVSQYLTEAGTSAERDDYYDPVSTLVGF